MAKLRVARDDLTTMAVDVVVNAANEDLQHGGGVAAALATAGGPQVQAESDAWVADHGPVGFGAAAVTTAGSMPAGEIVHVVGPRYSGADDDPDHLADAVLAACNTALDRGATSVALPAISCGVFGYPLAEASAVIGATARTWVGAHPDDAIEVILVGYSGELASALQAGVDGFDPLGGSKVNQPAAVDRPVMPEGYGVPESDAGIRTWTSAESRLAASAHYWLSTTRRDGRPHVVPRWGVWVDNHLFYDGAPTTRHVQNLHGNQACTLHLEPGNDVVVIDGTSGPTTPPSTWLTVRLVAAFAAKYADRGYAPGFDSWQGEVAGGLCRFDPERAMAWAEFPTDVTRWRW
jgi:O-acetyl-ADP-ribose deacetylase (regulator of RNase III)